MSAAIQAPKFKPRLLPLLAFADADDLFEAVSNDQGSVMTPALWPYSHPAARELVELLLAGVSRDALLRQYLCLPEQLACALFALRRGGIRWVFNPLNEVYSIPLSAQQRVQQWLWLNAHHASAGCKGFMGVRLEAPTYRVPTYQDLEALQPRTAAAWLERRRFKAHVRELLHLYGVESFDSLPECVRVDFLDLAAAGAVPNWAITPTGNDAGEGAA